MDLLPDSPIISSPPFSPLLPNHLLEYGQHALLAAPSPLLRRPHLSCSNITLQPLVVALVMSLDGLLQLPASASFGTVVSQDGPSEYGAAKGNTGTHIAQENEGQYVVMLQHGGFFTFYHEASLSIVFTRQY